MQNYRNMTVPSDYANATGAESSLNAIVYQVVMQYWDMVNVFIKL
jgi:hypothetical protein